MPKTHPFTSGELTLHHRAGGAGTAITCGVRHGCITAVVDDVACPRCLQALNQCGRCRAPFNPDGPAFDGRARYQDTAFCGSCVDRCHESTDFAHTCVICGAEN